MFTLEAADGSGMKSIEILSSHGGTSSGGEQSAKDC